MVGEDYPKLGETDYAPYLTKIKQSGAKAVFAFFSGTDAVNFVKQFDEFGLKQCIKLTGAGLPHRARRAARAGRAPRWASSPGISTRRCSTTRPISGSCKDFREKFIGKMPDGFACQGYDTAEVIVRALKAVNGNTQDKDKLVAAIATTEFDSPRGRFRFDPKTHNVIQPFIYVREVREVVRRPRTTSRSTRSPTCAIPAPAARFPRRSGATADAAGHAPLFDTALTGSTPRRADRRAGRGQVARPRPAGALPVRGTSAGRPGRGARSR